MPEREIRIGISGWTYAGWRGDFYPAGLPARKELAYSSRHFNAIEINGSFYSLQRPDSYRRWYEETPPGFQFAIKGSRFITHNKKLGDVDTALANFFASGVLLLREKLGPFLWQLAPAFRYNPSRVADFFARLPRDTVEAAELARGHDHRLDGRNWLPSVSPGPDPLRPPVQLFVGIATRVGLLGSVKPQIDEVGRYLLRPRPARAVGDDDGDVMAAAEFGELPCEEALLSRLDRVTDAAPSPRPRPADANTFSGMAPPRHRSRSVYVYFDNDAKVHAPKDAARLAERLGVG